MRKTQAEREYNIMQYHSLYLTVLYRDVTSSFLTQPKREKKRGKSGRCITYPFENKKKVGKKRFVY